MNNKIYEFDEFLLDLEQKRLMRNALTVSLQPKVFDLLVFFVEKRGELLSRDDLMQAVWADTFVEETNLRFCIHALRKALGKNLEGNNYIETIPKRGYRFVAEINEKLSQTVSEKREESLPPKSIEKAPKRNWLIGIFAFSAICFVLFLIAWQKNQTYNSENALGFNQLAVLPLGSANETQTDFQIGLTDAMITNLSKIKQLKVLPLASVSKFAGHHFDSANAGKELGADAVLSGTYRIDGDKIRVSLNLLRIASGEMLWTETFELNKSTNLELQTAVSLRTARLLSLKISDAEDERQIKSLKNLNSEAVQNYLSARKIWRRNELFRREEMIGLFEKTVQVEPLWALAYASYAEALIASDQTFIEWEKAEPVAKKALELDSTLAPPHTVLGVIYEWRDWNWNAAESEFKQAIALAPNDAPAFAAYSQFLQNQRRFAEAETKLLKAVEIEPFSPLYHTAFCQLYLSDRKFDKAIVACHQAEQIQSDFWLIRKALFQLYVEKKMYDELGEMVLGKLSLAEKAAHPLTKAFAENDLRIYFQSIVDTPSKSGREILVPNAAFYSLLGETEKALVNLENALAKRDIHLPSVNADSRFDAIRNEKRFIKIMSKIGL